MRMHIFHVGNGKGSCGSGIRDKHGVFLVASCSPIPYATDAHLAESLAMKHGLILTNNMGFHSIKIALNAVKVENTCAGQERV